MDDVLDIVTDYTVGDKRPSTAALLTAVGLVLGALLFFALVYARRKRVIKQKDTLERLNLIRQGRLDLRRRCLRPDGSVRQALFHEPLKNASHAEDQEEKPANSISNQIFETLTSGKLVKMINNFHVKTKRMKQRMDANVSPLERYEMEREAHLADETINPLYQFKRSRYATQASSDDDDDSADLGSDSESSD
jgi:hypothetical protein